MATLSAAELRAKYPGAVPVLGRDSPRLLNAFGYAKQPEADAVYLIDPYPSADVDECGTGHHVFCRLAPRGTPAETLAWAVAAMA